MIAELRFNEYTLVAVLAEDGSQLVIEDQAANKLVTLIPTAPTVLQIAPNGGTPLGNNVTAVSVQTP